MQVLSIAHDWLIHTFKFIAGLIVLAIFVLITLDVLLPLVGIQPWDGTLGVVEYGLLWFTILAAPWLARIKGHVFIDAVAVMLPPAVKKVTAKIAYLVAITGSLMLAYYSWLLLVESYVDENIDERSIELMLWWIYAPMPICFALVAIEFIRYLIGIDDMYGSRTDVKEGM
ncbi:MAG: TRAP transporter small permease subunit [Rhodospirillaceae bacterium]|nr:TRAP transporter small permease subunit [Rhodospirillaceae bacterium]MBT6285662.1 TRAP transporter small permease subunit [Rhodospirillaceae bacterium]